MSMLDKIRAMTGLGRAGAFNPGAKLFAQKQGTGKRLSPKEREKARKEREKEERRKRRDQRNQGRDDDVHLPCRGRDEGESQRRFVTVERWMDHADRRGVVVALGIKAFLFEFAARHSALTWKELVGDHPSRWKSIFRRLMNDPDNTVLFNLDGVDVWRGIARASTGGIYMTDWELLPIQQNPQWWPRIAWWLADRPAVNPFL